ncbi:hypothetical protein FJV41_23915 [Myxococcus llanfairpwllgwyngyllgogerychwyrndrobwllllantysiliogogogochensis]|uniref:Uncharacterized protein n=1 Tax=Myxococcus llanfairpwllgwyngyllgogerychwyrndrobwllllantysiliogogogochensis TaxID=2590453 RepID=A0A540WWR1_9BACT|nr:hypothetical protein [Myxococcus llanfairpwllgwyngyllgogerychwyrndrobwllllantysiliogogogochensis]TQF13439.1 hypothetical protein FJV41_23915 [Myxococcus llanfairpwllgwyngyllgogerychwyrndrobwllllantysiliogogogochensis]
MSETKKPRSEKQKPPSEQPMPPSEKKEKPRNYKSVSMRIRTVELEVMKAAAEALSAEASGPSDEMVKVDVSQLVYTAAMEQARELGFTATAFKADRTIKASKVWPYVPERSKDGGSLHGQTTISIHPLYLRTIQQAAQSVLTKDGEPVPLVLFLVGSTMWFIACRQRIDKRNRALQAIKLPSDFYYD